MNLPNLIWLNNVFKNILHMTITDDRVIDNKKIILEDQLVHILPDTKKASIAVGYFFISGFSSIVDYFEKINNSPDKNHKVRILMSPTTDQRTAEALIESNEHLQSIEKKISQNGYPSQDNINEKISDTNTKVKQSLEYMPQTDSDQDVVSKLLSMVKNKKLQVRVYIKEKLHAKAYIFELDNNQLPAIAIVGSSNMSISGIREHSELNLKTREPSDAVKLLEWFDEHWSESEPFTKELADIMTNSWAGKKRQSIDVYHKALAHEFKHKFDQKTELEIIKVNTMKLFDFQKDAVIDSISSLEKYGGIIVADVVGLGKSYIGSTILKYLQERDKTNALIICPPHLILMWEEYSDANNINAKIISRGKLGRDNFSLDKYSNCNLVLIDESHNFRNTNTKSYNMLESFMIKNNPKVIMLTATPLSNDLLDIKHQLKLFPNGNETSIPPADEVGLDAFFKRFSKEKLDINKEEFRDFLQHVMIRRTRKYIIENYADRDENDKPYITVNEKRQYFPKRDMSNPEQYDIDKVYIGKYDSIEQLLGNKSLKLARYVPGKYLLPEYQNDEKYVDLFKSSISLEGLIRTSLLKRMESSVAAFASSIEHYKLGCERFIEYLREGKMPIGKEFSKEIYDTIIDISEGEEDIDFKMPDIISKYDIKAFDIDQLQEDIINDIAKFNEIESRIPKNKEKDDDKLHKLKELIQTNINKKILVFTESKVTADYIGSYIKKEIKELSDKMAIVSSSSEKKMNIVKRFDPEHNPGKESVDNPISLLISTDVLAEGVNLQTGQMVINYDFHWNPTKLIQRVGRIDRIGSNHEKIEIINFLPNPQLEKSLNLKKIVESKIGKIHDIIGMGNPILTNTEQVNTDAMYAVYDERNDDILDTDDILSFQASKFETDVRQIRNTGKWQDIESLPYGIRSTVGNRKLLISCEAINPNGTAFRRYYEVGSDLNAKKTTAGIVLSKIKEYTNTESKDDANDYNKRIKAAWEQFILDMNHVKIRQPKPRSYQKWFSTKLIEISQRNPHREKDISRLVKFSRHPILDRTLDTKMKNLYKSAQKGVGDMKFLEELELIHDEHIDDIKETRREEITKPKILYSMMVD